MCILAAVNVLTLPASYQLAAKLLRQQSSSSMVVSKTAFRTKLTDIVSAAGVVSRTVNVVDSLGLRGGYSRRGRAGRGELPPEESRRTALEQADIAGKKLDLVPYVNSKVFDFARLKSGGQVEQSLLEL